MSNEWPFEDQRKNPLARARHVAGMYRHALGLTNPVHMAELDELVSKYGEKWVRDRTSMYDDTDLITSKQAAEALGISIEALRQHRLRGRVRAADTVDGWRYLVADVRAFRPIASGRKRKE